MTLARFAWVLEEGRKRDQKPSPLVLPWEGLSTGRQEAVPRRARVRHRGTAEPGLWPEALPQ